MATGSWVTAGELLQDVVDSANPLTKNIVVAGHDRSEICLLVIPDEDGMC